MASPSDPDLTLEQAREERDFVEILISTLDPASDNFDEARADLEARKMRWAHVVEHLQSGSDLSPSSTEEHEAVDEGDQWLRNAMSGEPADNNGDSDDEEMAPFGSQSPYRASTSNSAKRRRTLSSHLESDDHVYKRQAPVPSNSGSHMRSENPYGAGNRQLSNGVWQRQMAAELAHRRQREAQQSDAAFAQNFGQQINAASSQRDLSSASRPSFQTTLTYDGSYSRPPAMKSDPSPPAPPQGYHDSTVPWRIKAEPGSSRQAQQLPERLRQPTTETVDLTGDDDDDDINEIAATSFTPSHYPQDVPTSSFHAPVRTTMLAPTTMQQQQYSHRMPGSYPISHPSDTQFAYGNSANTYPAANQYSWLQQRMSSIRSVADSLTRPMQDLSHLIYGSSSSYPMSFEGDDDDDDDDLIFRGSRRLYADNEDLYRSRYDALAAYDSTKTKEELHALLENIRPDEEMPSHLRVQTPDAMAVKLHKYQELGLTWLKKCEEGSNKGGILADDMGLGKTIQMLALLVTRKSENPACKTTLIVAPLALMRQWAQEISSKLKLGRHQLSVFTHHGSKKAKSFDELRFYDVVLTTYGSIASDVKKREKFELRRIGNPDLVPNQNEKCLFIDPKSHWYRVILDEAQCIKNRSTQTSKGACLLQADYRFCVTGTPMMNNIEEFYSLIKFLRIKPYCVWDKFRIDIGAPLRSVHLDTKRKAMQKLQALCKAVMLRRTKKSEFEGKPILVLPERSTEVDKPVFSEDERNFYKAVETQTQLDFNKYLRRGTIGTSYTAILVLLLRLRQACCHPHLIKDFGVAAAADLQEEDLIAFARELAEPVVSRIKEAGGNFECPVCYDVTPNPAIFIPCGHDTCSECFTRIADPSNAIQHGEERSGIKCPNCRGPINPKRLTDFNAFKKVHMPELLTTQEREENSALEDGSDSDSDESSTESDTDDAETGSLNGFIVNDNAEDDENDENEDELDRAPRNELERGLKAESSNSKENTSCKSKEAKGKGKASEKSNGKGKAKAKAKKHRSAVTLAELKKLASRSKSHKRAYLRRLRKNWISSAKIDKTLEILRTIMDDPEAEKVLVFSQWTSLLDLLEIPIDHEGWGYRRYDGSMTATMRGDAVDDFRDDAKNVRILLVSLKAGNAGLNLNMASQVILMDPFWNPYIEEQAVDRAHRFGQMRPVKVHRVLVEETVEDRITALQEKKRALISEALDEQQANALSRLGVQELAYLFGVTHDPTARIQNQAQSTRQNG